MEKKTEKRFRRAEPEDGGETGTTISAGKRQECRGNGAGGERRSQSDCEAVVWTARTAPSRLPDDAGGSFASKAEALLWLGWSPETVALRESDEAHRREFGDWARRREKSDGEGLKRCGSDAGWERFRTWGKALMQAMERKRTVVRIAYYVFRAQRNAGADIFGGVWEDFQRVFERAAFVVGGVLNRSAKYMWKLRNEVCAFVDNLWKLERRIGVNFGAVNKSEGLCRADFHDTRARQDNSKIVKGCLNIASADFEAADAAGAVKADGIRKFRGRLQGRGSVWRVLEAAHEAAKRAHGRWYWEDCLYSGAHLFSWLRACFVAGKDLSAACRLYADAVDRHRGTGSGKAFLPKMFARLYREAAELPRFINPKTRKA